MICKIDLVFNSIINEKVLNFELMKSSQNTVYKINTNSNSYILKRYDELKSDEDLKTRKEQLRISKIWDDNGIDVVLPITDIFKYEEYYYIIYPYVEGVVYKKLNIDQIKTLARLLAKMHKLEITTFLENHTKTIEVFDNKLEYFIKENNKSFVDSTGNLCVCHNDYKPLNILWVNNKPFLIDFDAVGKNNRTFSLVESAYTFSYIDGKFELNLFDTFIKEYKDEYKDNIENIESSIYGSWSGKLQWLNYLEENRKDDIDINLLINELFSFKEHEEEIRKILLKK